MSCRGVVLVVVAGLAAAPVWAEDVTKTDADACEPDIHRLCDNVFPDEALVGKCLVDRRADLSRSCAEALARPRHPGD